MFMCYYLTYDLCITDMALLRVNQNCHFHVKIKCAHVLLNYR